MTMEKDFKKYDRSRQEMLAYHGGTCNRHDFEAGYKAAIAATADQLQQAKVEVLREAAYEYEKGAREADISSRVFLRDANARVANHLLRMADEIERSKT